jgi:hypothetical protein
MSPNAEGPWKRAEDYVEFIADHLSAPDFAKIPKKTQAKFLFPTFTDEMVKDLVKVFHLRHTELPSIQSTMKMLRQISMALESFEMFNVKFSGKKSLQNQRIEKKPPGVPERPPYPTDR